MSTSAATIPILGRVDAPTTQPKYRGLSEEARYALAVSKAPYLASDEASTEQAIDAAFARQDTEALKWAIWEHLASNPELAERVANEVLRKLPWYPVPDPLTPISGKMPASHLVNWLAARRHRDMQRETWARQHDVPLDAYQSEPLLYSKVGERDGPDGHEELQEFLSTLPAEERELAQECLFRNRERPGFRALVHKAKEWAETAATAAPWECDCYSCTPRSYSSLDALRAVDDLGCLPATIGLLKGLPARRPRPAGWQLERIKVPQFTDRWKSRGRSHSKPAFADPDAWKGVPAALYHQITEGC